MTRTRTILVAGTASHVGKSTVAAGLCRHLADQGVSVAPFKAQNMSNNARVVVRPDAAGDDADDDDVDASESADASTDRWGEIGVSQFVQARAARTTPTTDCNPVLLKPRGDGESQLVVQGRALTHLSAGSYYDEYWHRAREAAEKSYERLAADHDVIVAEGAGSIGEINLHDRDLANVEAAEFADAEILLLVDIERGGAFASLYGTLELMPDHLRERVIGTAITKFRGDASLLEPGIDEIEDRTGVPVLGVLPYADPGLPEEDSVGLPDVSERGVRGDDDGVPADQRIRIGVPRLPRISNATDLEALAGEPGVSVAYLPVDPEKPVSAQGQSPLADADAVVLPGTKNTVDDLRALREAGYQDALERFDGPTVGLCGGYQVLGERLTNAALEGTDEQDELEGLGLLPVETQFEPDKHVEQATVPVDGEASPLLAGASGTASGYEIHAGRTRPISGADVTRPLGDSSAACGVVLGTYLHGVFDEAHVREAFLAAVARHAGVDWPPAADSTGDGPVDGGDDGPATDSVDGTGRLDGATPYDRAATLVREHVDLAALGEPFR
ncbi:cobyric acid synthase [Natrarchaeobaculum aegyptiacum]|uniref:Probable cobyric acid synthase n=1 Tax=Natrarchaeobaculum aegyptiacum TaxID=745377 RepID=A0A2Z2HTE7_9EURY|nr:cobyric acid synthase [Natrarchaeobaculum aegyptiacum]ARS88687.1 cobyric acid synthase CobQ [Natrarchaeobaculum aegyptiacum]